MVVVGIIWILTACAALACIAVFAVIVYYIRKHPDGMLYSLYALEVCHLTDTDTDIAIFKKQKPIPTRYLEKNEKIPTIENKNHNRNICSFFPVQSACIFSQFNCYI